MKGCKLLILSKIAKKTSFWAKNDVIRRKYDVTRQKFFFKIFNTSRGTTFSPTALPENDIKRVKNRKNCQKMRFSYKSYIKSLLNGFLTRLLLTTPLATTFIGKNLVFLNPCDIPQLKNIVKKFPPPLDFARH